jgi:hypothetical protein
MFEDLKHTHTPSELVGSDDENYRPDGPVYRAERDVAMRRRSSLGRTENKDAGRQLVKIVPRPTIGGSKQLFSTMLISS